ncbi:unnamed protein product (macronuclear) [Paramecium tetraurelia]|uniref:Uncharacterized protein n=1 Tax=Paramecium tetraurelia TaxID=5888 RepID=A0BYI7_PARTE|nr:uncharacterized protein GSPATT00033457001 [Paramecium tetraurelia]CAK63604.1 unnamed protein product [Paramecium tetraurelia]|eukprot:XP_001431002.1 hypothetical protein (macronuclear) [Paramecium tetraurelia strain d4-2]
MSLQRENTLIKENRLKRIQKLFVARSLAMNEPQTQSDRNIFQEINDEFNIDKGPKYNQKGEIIKHSIIGKPDWFNKTKYGKKQTQFDEFNLRQLPQKSQTRIDQDQKSMAKSDVKSLQKGGGSGKFKKEKRDQLTTKTQLLEELEKIKDRIELNKEIEQRKIKELQLVVRCNATKQERVMDKHTKMEQYWNDFTYKQANQLGRFPSDCQLIQAENYRTRLEAAAAFDALKTDYERFGPRVWQMTLRKPDQSNEMLLKLKDTQMIVENEIKYDFIVGSDLPNAFTESSVCGHKGGIEYYRKPNFLPDSSQLTFSSRFRKSTDSEMNQSSLPFKSFRSEEYLMKKIEKQKSQFNQSHMLSIDKTDGYDQLIILGKNQYEIEKQMLLHDGTDNTGVYRKNIEKIPEELTKEQIYEQNFTGTQRLILPQIYKTQMSRIKRQGSATSRSQDSRSSQDFQTENQTVIQ